jgi:hypothetical protein
MGGKAGSSGRDAAEDKRREEEEVALGFPKDDFERVKNEDPSWVDKKGQTKEKRVSTAACKTVVSEKRE